MKRKKLMLTCVILVGTILISACGLLEPGGSSRNPAGPANPASQGTRLPTPVVTPGPTITAGPNLTSEVVETEAPEPTEAPDGLRIVDGCFQELYISGPAERVISLHAGVSDLLAVVEAADLIIARGEDLPGEASDPETALIPLFDGQYDLSELRSHDPDIIFIAADQADLTWLKYAREAGLMVYCVGQPKDLLTYFKPYSDIGIITDRAVQMSQLIVTLQERINRLDLALRANEQQPGVYYEASPAGTEPYVTAGQGSIANFFIQRSGAQNLGDQFLISREEVSLSEVQRFDPDWIILEATNGASIESLTQRSGWENLATVQSGQVIVLENATLAALSPTNIAAYEILVQYLYPELFPEDSTN